MRWLVVTVVAVHGLIHLMGFAKAFGFAELPQLTQPIARGCGVAWLGAAFLVIASAVALGVEARGFWKIGAVALVLSQIVIVSSWRDAWAGTIANVILLVAVAHGWLTEGPASFRAQFARDAATQQASESATSVVSEDDLARLPAPVQRYLREAGVVGQPRVRSYGLRFRGRIRSGPQSAWMPFEAEQYSLADPPTRLFLMHARMRGLPVEAFHRSVGGHATMQVKVAGLITMVDARGDVMDRSEAVTVFNDMCLLAPATLVDPRIEWQAVDAQHARAWFTNGGQRIAATLIFGDDGLLTDFVSDDRSQLSADSKTATLMRFSTPVRGYQPYGAARLARHGEARWHALAGPFTYGEFELLEASYNPPR
jgi:hypothetical protein